MPPAPPFQTASELRRPPAARALVRASPEDSLLVLVVDDDEDTRSLYMDALSAMGYRTAGEPDGARGVEAALRLRPDAVLMDVSMPVLNGIDATRQLKEDPRTSGSLVILMTGHGMKKIRGSARRGLRCFLLQTIRSGRAPGGPPHARVTGGAGEASCAFGHGEGVHLRATVRAEGVDSPSFLRANARASARRRDRASNLHLRLLAFGGAR